MADSAIPVEPSAGDEGYDSSTSAAGSTYATTISSYITNGIKENGRQYAAYCKHTYGMPVDEREQERNDLQHAKFNMVIGDKLFTAPVEPTNVLDLGTGSGIWAFDVADKYENAIVTGVDLAPVQPAYVPPNCSFEVLDVEDEWMLKKNSYDLIHAREMLMSIRDYPKLFAQGFEHLKPGGYFEVSSSIASPKTDDGSLKEDSALLRARDMFYEMADKMGTSIDAPLKFKEQLEAAGFVDVVENRIKMPQGPWPKDSKLKKIGAYENYSLASGAEAYLMRGYTSVMGGDPDELRVQLVQMYKELADPSIHSWVY